MEEVKLDCNGRSGNSSGSWRDCWLRRSKVRKSRKDEGSIECMGNFEKDTYLI